MRDADGRLARIVEAADASPEELALGEVNSGIYVFRADKLWPVLDRLEPHNAQGELYVTDTLGLLVADGETVAVHTAPVAWEVEGINTRVELAFVAGEAARPDQRGAHARGRHDRRSGLDLDRGRRRDRAPTSRSIPSPCIRGDVRIATGVEVGPVRLSPAGNGLGEGAKVGTFVEVKKSTVGARTKIPHLSYIGDAEIGEDTNIAAGNITANFSARAGQAQGTDADREQRQDRCRQYVQCTCGHWR